jgi:hypothetical protein
MSEPVPDACKEFLTRIKKQCGAIRESLIKSFDKLGMNGNLLIPFVVSLSNHERNQINQRFPKFARY